MAIQIYDMGVDFTKGERTHESFSDFRHKQGQANQANATASKYTQEVKEAEYKQKLLLGDREHIANLRKLYTSEDDEGEPFTNRGEIENGMIKRFFDTGRTEEAFALKAAVSLEKKKSQEAMKEWELRTEKGAAFLARHPTMENAKYLAEEMIANKNPNGVKFMKMIESNKGATPDDIYNFAMKWVPTALQNPNMKSKGGSTVDMGEFSDQPEVQNTISPDAVGRIDQQRKNELGRDIRAENIIKDKKAARVFRKEMLTGRYSKRSMELMGRTISVNESVSLIDLMLQSIIDNPRSTSTLMALPARAWEAIRGTWDPKSNAPNPALRQVQLRNLLLATTEALHKKSRMSNQDRQRIETALGGDWLTNPTSSTATLQNVRQIMLSTLEQGYVVDPDETTDPANEEPIDNDYGEGSGENYDPVEW